MLFACVFNIATSLIVTGGCSTSSGWKKDPDIRRMVQNVSAERIESKIRKLVAFETRHTSSETDSHTRGIGAARRWIESEFRRISSENGGRLLVETDGYRQPPDGRRILSPVDIINVIAQLPGSQPQSADRTYLVAGHYDSIPSDPKDFNSDAPGANDDASGVAAVLELARIMSQHEFDATIIFMAIAGEEQGLYGSKHAAHRFREKNVRIDGMFTNDIIGNSRSMDGIRECHRVRVFSVGTPPAETPEQTRIRIRVSNENDSQSRQLARYIDQACDTYVPGFDVTMIFRLDRLMRGGDHKSFAMVGYPGVRFTEVNENYHHQHQNVRVENGVQFGDLPEFVDFEYVADVTRTNLAALASLARAPARPAGAQIVTEKLSPHTTLRWTLGSEPDLAGYEIVWRDTTAPQWQHVQHVGKTTEVTMPLSKDNVVFGICAVDHEGHRSDAAYPLPSKIR